MDKNLLPLPISPKDFNEKVLTAAFGYLPAKMNTPAARVEMIAIALQESRLANRFQIVQGKPGAKGPARGLFQFEQGGGVRGVLNHASTKVLALDVCQRRSVVASPATVWAALETDDVLAACFARLLLWTDPKPMPAVGQSQAGWDLYNRVWRPGKPHPQTWDRLYQQAVEAVTG